MATALIDTDRRTVLVTIEVADTPELRARGLMHRTSLPDNHGMLFVFFEDTTSAFHMKDTQIPLSIAFFDFDGKILELIDMDPCTSEPCPTYAPKAAYRGALEVTQGAFDEWGVTPGDTIRVAR